MDPPVKQTLHQIKYTSSRVPADRYSVTHSTKSDLDFNNGVTCFGKRRQDKNNKGIVGIRGLAGETPAPPFSAALSS